ncbi:MAG: hypothetical protein JNK12_15235 [Acidimicrobiales bacterium]|nr:hypothetical protein [Acidimicrobiales bacterium]
MPEGLDRFASTALRDLVPVDVASLAHRARRRRRSRRGALVASIAAVLVVPVALVVLPDRGEQSQEVITGPDNPAGYILTGDPVGTWTQAADPPFSPRAEAFSATLNDGRVLVWGGVDDESGGHSEVQPGGLADGGIYDPDADAWIVIPAPPEGTGYASALLEDDRLLVLGRDDQVSRAAVYDVATNTWTVAPERPFTGMEGTVGWNGETVVAIATGRFTAADGAPAPELTTTRWTLGENRWQPGVPFPLTPRSLAGSDANGDLVAIWGGTSTTLSEDLPLPDLGNDEGLLGDGAIYDIATDTWATLPAAPIEPATDPALLWEDGRLLVGGGNDGRSDHEWTASHRRTPARFDPATGDWQVLPPGPRISFDGVVPANSPTGPSIQYDFGPPTFVVAADSGGARGLHTWFLHDDEWEQAPYVSIHGDHDGLLVSSTDWDSGNPEEYPFDLAVRLGPGRWRPAIAAPFTNRSGSSVRAIGDRILLIGGYETSAMVPAADAWIFDPAG